MSVEITPRASNVRLSFQICLYSGG
jgi:hypothetical protein